MQIPVEIAYRNLDSSPAIEDRIHQRVRKLEKLAPDLIACRVMIEAPHGHHHQGRIYHVRVDVTVPGHEVVVSRDPGQHHAHEDLHVAIRDAFDAVERRLEDVERRRRGQVKQHEVLPHGRVSEIVPALDYGRIETPDGRDLYFHRNALVEGDFDRLEVGDEVRFVEEMGEQGAQASTVHPVGKHHPVG
ncbi:MAG: HPF/RaiA family ribosome-associated protein [Candidatus Macondimonas sp.]